MKKVFNYFILTLISVSSLTAHASDVDSQMTGVNLKSCDSQNQKCIEIKFNKATMSQWTPLFAFTNYEITFSSNNEKIKSKKITGKKGYFDLDQNKIVITTEDIKPKEISINLKTLEQQEFQL